MRVSPAAWLAKSHDEALALARHVTAVTHNHPEGIKGAEATVTAIWLARQGLAPGAIRERTRKDLIETLGRKADLNSQEMRQTVPRLSAWHAKGESS